MNTDELIQRLASDLAPVEPLRRPAKRAAAWLVGAGLYVGVFLLLTRSGGAFTDRGTLWAQLAALAACVLAALAAFASVVPGHSRVVFVWPLIAVLAWLGMLVAGATWPGEAVTEARHELACVGLIVLGGAPLLVALAAMLRRGAPFQPAVTGAFAALAVGALTSAGACFWRPHADDAVTLIWHGGAILAVVVACVLGARFALSVPGR
ncbi:MAG TPA: NrsF family protein [Gammaproteobacteria bacterium]|nr:NrsF family protein [Gammaproteobacteria bacterium]